METQLPATAWPATGSSTSPVHSCPCSYCCVCHCKVVQTPHGSQGPPPSKSTASTAERAGRQGCAAGDMLGSSSRAYISCMQHVHGVAEFQPSGVTRVIAGAQVPAKGPAPRWRGTCLPSLCVFACVCGCESDVAAGATSGAVAEVSASGTTPHAAYAAACRAELHTASHNPIHAQLLRFGLSNRQHDRAYGLLTLTCHRRAPLCPVQLRMRSSPLLQQPVRPALQSWQSLLPDSSNPAA